MLKSFSLGFSKFFTTERIIILVVFLILDYGLYAYSGSKGLKMDGMNTGVTTGPVVTTGAASTSVPSASITSAATSAASTSVPSATIASLDGGYSAVATTSPKDLLPKDQNSQWAALNPVGQGNIAAPDLLQAGYHIGLDTIGQTLRNANLQERSDPIIPKAAVGPWNQSTIEPDLGRVPLEVGAGSP